MTTPTLALSAALSHPGLPGEACFPPLALVPAAPARGDASRSPRFFTVQIAAQVYHSLPLPAGLDGGAAERYVRAFALAQGRDCRVDRAGSKTVYLLSDGARFEAAN